MSNADTYGADKDFNKLTHQTRQFGTKSFLGYYDKISDALADTEVKTNIEGGEAFVPSRETSTVEVLASGETVAAPGGFQVTVAEPNVATDKYTVAELEQMASANRDAYRTAADVISNPGTPAGS